MWSRGYYKCITVRGCPARHVEGATDDPTVLVVTYDYEGEHHHTAARPSPPATASPVAAAVSAGNGVSSQS